MANNHFYETKEELVSYVKEAGAAYGVDPLQRLQALNMLNAKKQGDFTSEDYYELAEEYNVELIDGVFYKNAAPTTVHQQIAGRVYLRFGNYILSKKGSCRAFFAPADVKIDCDENTILHPDMFVVCDKDKIRKGEIWGAPDFVLEVLSPGTKNRDLIVKLYKYQQAGVREYWIIDPMKELLYVYDLAGDGSLQVYELTGEIGVRIYGGDLQINLDEIREVIREMPDEYSDLGEIIGYVKEAGAAYSVDKIQQRNILNLLNSKEQGEFTVDDLDVFPEEFHVELIDGVLYFLNAPSVVHQAIQTSIAAQIYNYIRKKKGKCRVFATETNVLLNRDNKTNVHPDILIICEKEKMGAQAIEGAPDFVLEILSPSTGRFDQTVKLYKYRTSGVREYWVIDPEREQVYVYDFSKESSPRILKLAGKVGVGIYDGDLQIDLDEVLEWIRGSET